MHQDGTGAAEEPLFFAESAQQFAGAGLRVPTSDLPQYVCFERAEIDWFNEMMLPGRTGSLPVPAAREGD